MLYDNPAERLRDILQRGRELKQDMRCREAWEQVLGVKQGDTDDLFAKLGKIMASWSCDLLHHRARAHCVESSTQGLSTALDNYAP
jgi:hypothetical protein